MLDVFQCARQWVERRKKKDVFDGVVSGREKEGYKLSFHSSGLV